MIYLRSRWTMLMREHEASCPRIHPVKDVEPECINRFRWIVASISFRDWKFKIIETDGGILLKIFSYVKDSKSGEMTVGNSKPLALCPEMSDGFIVDLTFEMVKEHELHEAAENFTFRNTAIYFPHNSSCRGLKEVPAMRSSVLIDDDQA
jgi:hypothetical protein